MEIPGGECKQLSSAFESRIKTTGDLRHQPSTSTSTRLDHVQVPMSPSPHFSTSPPESCQPEPFSFSVGSRRPCPRTQNVQKFRLAAYQLRIMPKVIMAEIEKKTKRSKC